MRYRLYQALFAVATLATIVYTVGAPDVTGG